ncbi:hypothetical protein C8F04DRAFT_1201554 [Mycena alexandri]|uniref:Uncharacterized protein n=1 Tax=Mycena alexandri TaxID=1745969 RepID=A0AAD6S0Q6_9AGAR|nr:hypothetical protein C8F04DRAFT_1201554 [Mycena alexandri]
MCFKVGGFFVVLDASGSGEAFNFNFWVPGLQGEINNSSSAAELKFSTRATHAAPVPTEDLSPPNDSSSTKDLSPASDSSSTDNLSPPNDLSFIDNSILYIILSGYSDSFSWTWSWPVTWVTKLISSKHNSRGPARRPLNVFWEYPVTREVNTWSNPWLSLTLMDREVFLDAFLILYLLVILVRSRILVGVCIPENSGGTGARQKEKNAKFRP